MTDTAPALDAERSEAFLARMGDTLNAAFTALSISLGHKTRLFDTMSRLPPSTSQRIADAADLDERYVREWLGAMTSAKIVEYSSTADTYRLPPEHATFLTRASGPANLAAITPFLGELAKVEDKIIECFHEGGGVGYQHFTGFHAAMAELSGQRNDALLVRRILPMVPGIVEHLEAGIHVADVGCGQGHAVNLMAKAFPRSTFVGLDIADEALDVGRKEAGDWGLGNATFEVCDAPTMDRPEEFDFITTFDAVHDQVDPQGMVDAIYRALKPGGAWLCFDICASSHVGENVDHPLGPMMYTISCMHCMTVSLAGDGAGLGAMWGVQKAREVFANAGFVDVTVDQVPGDNANNVYIARKHEG